MSEQSKRAAAFLAAGGILAKGDVFAIHVAYEIMVALTCATHSGDEGRVAALAKFCGEVVKECARREAIIAEAPDDEPTSDGTVH